MADPIAARIEPLLMLNSYKKEKLTHLLTTIGDGHTAEQYTASAIAKSFLLAAVGLTTIFISPLLPAVFGAMAVVGYFQAMKEPDKLLKAKRERIELELPRFASTISNSLTASRDVVKILEQYRRVCGAELAGELEVTLADMKTGNPQNALRSFENRIGSTKLSELIRGLLSVLRGEDQVLYFYTKNVELRHEYIEYQKQTIQKRPDKLTGYILGIVGCFFVMLFYIIGTQLMGGSASFF